MGERVRREQVLSHRSSQQPGFSLEIQLPSRLVSRLLGVWFCLWVGVNNRRRAGQAEVPRASLCLVGAGSGDPGTALPAPGSSPPRRNEGVLLPWEGAEAAIWEARISG